MLTMPVIFRADRKKEFGTRWITAVFPTDPASCSNPDEFTLYQHVGQHGAANLGWYRRTRAATPEEYADLLAELQGIYGTSRDPDDPIVTLRVVARFDYRYHAMRRAAFARMR